MTDAREALVELLWEKFGAWPNGPLAAWLTEADCARFADAILGAGWTPPAEDEWEYSIAYPDEREDGSVRWNTGGVEPMCSREDAEHDLATGDYLTSDRVVRRRKAGPWEAVEDE